MEEEGFVKQRLKVVTVMDCVPGDTTDDDVPITILTLAHDGEIEEPLCVSIEDTERLVVDLLISLASHDDEFARYLVDTYFSNADDDDDEGEDEQE